MGLTWFLGLNSFELLMLIDRRLRPIHWGNKRPIDCVFTLRRSSLVLNPPPAILASSSSLSVLYWWDVFVLFLFFFHTGYYCGWAHPDLSQGAVAETQCRFCLCSQPVCSTDWVMLGGIDNGSAVNTGMKYSGIYSRKCLNSHCCSLVSNVRPNAKLQESRPSLTAFTVNKPHG